MVRIPTHRTPTHPGEMLRDEFLAHLDGVTQGEIARRLGITRQRLNEIINGRRSVTPDTALRLERLTGMEAQFWLNLQIGWDLWHAERSVSARELARIERLEFAATES